jgi:hypothetical protein
MESLWRPSPLLRMRGTASCRSAAMKYFFFDVQDAGWKHACMHAHPQRHRDIDSCVNGYILTYCHLIITVLNGDELTN